MKKFFLPFVSILFFLVTSCNDVIFDDIRKEVALEDADISGGAVNCIVRFNDDLYTQNGNIYKKDATLQSAHSWTRCEKPNPPADYKFVNKLAADNTCIYAQVTLVNEDSEDEELKSTGNQIWYSTDGNNWQGPITFTTSTGETITTFPPQSYYYYYTIDKPTARLFCTNSIEKSNRKAFVNYRGELFTLNGTSSVTGIEATGSTSDVVSATPSSLTVDCVSLGGTVYYSSTHGVTTNETTASPGDTVYYAKNGRLYYGNGTSWSSVPTTNSFVYALGVTNNYIYLGTADGIMHQELSAWIPGSLADFKTNADSALSPYYEIHNVLVMNPENDELDTVIYGTSTFSGLTSNTSAKTKNCGLWSFIPSRGSWNRE